MTEIEYIKELVDDNTRLREEITRLKDKIVGYMKQNECIYNEIHKAQVREAQYSFTTKEDIYKAPVASNRLCEIMSYNAGICEEALAILKAKEVKNDD